MCAGEGSHDSGWSGTWQENGEVTGQLSPDITFLSEILKDPKLRNVNTADHCEGIFVKVDG